MLTQKNLLNYKKLKGKILPVFIDATNDLLNEFSGVLIEIFMSSLGKTRKEIENQTEDFIAAFDIDSTVAQGLLKLCFDLLTFESLLSTETAEFRAKVFRSSFSFLTKPGKNSTAENLNEIKAHQQNVALDLNFSMGEIEKLLYSDLPEYHKVTEVKSITALQLLNKYNVSLVQGLLFYCSKVKIILPAVNSCKAQFRQLLKHIKFFQLVAYFTKKNDLVEIEIDGPLSLFVHTQKYGFNLACFFPALLFMPQWELIANIEMGKDVRKHGELHLSHKTSLISHYKNYSAYIPEEFNLFAESFSKQENCAWRINENCDEILFDGENYFFPDFEFVHNNGERVYLELFHPWHAAALKHRISAIEKKALPFNFILGIAKVLLKEPDYATQFQESCYLKNHSFTFREVLSVEKVLQLLERF